MAVVGFFASFRVGLVLGLLTLSLYPHASAFAQGGPDSSLGKPSAKDQVIDAVRGEPIQIKLITESKSPAAKVDFVVNDVPYYGTLGGRPRVDSRTPTEAVITYQSDPNSIAEADTFTWYARYMPNGPYSAPARVTIRLKDPAPVLELSEQVYFGRTAIGRESVRELRAANIGNATYQQKLELKSPWHLVEPANGEVTLKPGEAMLLKIAFRPIEQGSTLYEFMLLPGKEGKALLNGDGYLPFKADPAKLELAYDPVSRVRSADLAVYGLAPTDAMVTIHTDGRLVTPAGGRLLARSGNKHILRFALPATDAKAYKGFVTLETNGFSTQVEIDAPPTPAYLEVQMPDGSSTINFGEVVPGISLSRAFRILNSGGSAATLDLQLAPPFELLSTDASRALPALSSRDYTVVFSTPENSRSALFRESLSITSGDDEQSFAVSAVVKVPAAPNPTGTQLPLRTNGGPMNNPLPHLANPGSALPAPVPLPAARDEDEDRKLRTPLGTLTIDLLDRNYSNRVQPVPKFDVFERRRTSLVIGWPLPSTQQRQFVVDMRQTRKNLETFAIDSVWVPWQDVDFDIDDEGLVRATILGLTPGSIFEFRVLSVTADGRYSEPSEPVGILTLPPIDWTWFERIVILCGIALVGWLGWRVHLARQG